MFSGSIVAIVTPMNFDGSIDFNSFKKLIEYHIFNDTTSIVVAGTTGEVSTLDHNEYINLISKAVEYSDGRIPIIVGVSSNSTAKAISKILCINNINGISGCLVTTPYYNKPTQKGMYLHFKHIAENTNLPQIIYNVPSRTSSDLLPSTIARLSKINNIVGIKEATGDLSRVNKILYLLNGRKFFLLSGDDITALDFMILGGNGVISVTANIAAKEIARVCFLFQSGDLCSAKLLNKKLLTLHHALFCETNPVPIKWACKVLNLISSDTVRLPMLFLSNKYKKLLNKILYDFKFI